MNDEMINFLTELKNAYECNSNDFTWNYSYDDIYKKGCSLKLCRIEYVANDYVIKITKNGLDFLQRISKLKAFW